MDYSSANAELWMPIFQIGVISALILFSNVLRRKVSLITRSLLPISVLAGFMLLLIRYSGILPIDADFLEVVTYHALALGFIALALRIPTKENTSGALLGSKCGALIVSTYLVQAILGLAISLGLAYTVMPGLFKASGILLPMAYGQGPGQANNVGTTYEALGFAGGRTFGLSLAAAGYLCACIVGVIFLNVYAKTDRLKRHEGKNEVSGSVTIDTYQDSNEIPIAESVDKLSVQAALVAIVYLITYVITLGITTLLTMVAPGAAATISTLLWGFNFIIGSVVAMGTRAVLSGLRSAKLMNRQYQNNYLLSRISGLAFDLMIVCGIAGINIDDLSGLWVPFILMAALGGMVTFFYLRKMCDTIFPEYRQEAFFSLYGMLTGTLSSGVLLLREVDPDMKTPAANNLITGSSFGIVFGAPVLLLVSLAAESLIGVWLTLVLAAVYLIILLLYIFKIGQKKG